MPDNLPNPDASVVVTPNNTVQQPQVQSQDMGEQQIPQQPTQAFNPPTRGVPTSPQQQANVANLAAATKTHLGWGALMGQHTTYAPDPNNPSGPPIPQTTQNSPKQLFRSILAGAIMGMGAGAEAKMGGGIGSFAVGASAGAKSEQEQRQRDQQQAQQQWQNQLAQQKEKREETAADQENLVRKAQITQANAETLRSNILTQGSSFELYQKIADADKDRISTFVNAGVKPRYEDITESQMNDLFKNSPGASSLDWRHTGVKTVLDKDGNPNYEYTLSAYDPNATAPLSKATVAQWDKDGLFKYHPEYKDVAKEGKVLSVDQFTALDKQAQNFANQTLAQTKSDLEVEHVKAQIDEAKAAVKAHNASAFAETLNAQEKQKEMSRRNEEDKAWDALSKAGNDPDKVTDAHMRTVLARSVQPLMQETLSAIKTAAAENDIAEQASLWGKYNTYQKLASLAPGSSAPPADPIQATVDSLKGKSAHEVAASLNDPKNKVPEAVKAQVWKKLGMQPPSALSPLGQSVVKAAETVGPVLNAIPNL